MEKHTITKEDRVNQNYNRIFEEIWYKVFQMKFVIKNNITYNYVMSLEYNKNRGLYLPEKKEKSQPIDTSEVEQICASESQRLSPQTVEEFIEKPLVESVRRLVLKHIPTITSSANGINNHDSAYLAINYSKLSKANTHVADKLVKDGSARIIKNYRNSGVDALHIELKGDSKGLPYNKIENHYITIADKFFEQSPQINELGIHEIEKYTAKLVGYENVEAMRNDMTQESMDELIGEVKAMFDWSENPLVGIKKEK